MKKIKIKTFLNGADGGKASLEDYFPSINFNKYSVIETEDPDYLFYIPSVYNDYFKYDCIRVAVEPERYSADFNICDYAITDDYITFLDRHFRLPYLSYTFMRSDINKLREREKKVLTHIDIEKKEYFCNFIYSNDLADGYRTLLFNELSKYKKIQSGGRLHNNMGYIIPGGISKYDDKINFQNKCKFTLAIENENSPGYTTEKIVHGFIAETIPIYWGNSKVNELFNPDSFINASNYNSMDELIEEIIAIDCDNDRYLSIINQPIINPNYSPEKHDLEVAKFIENIFAQNIEDSKRRGRNLHTTFHERDLMYGKSRRKKKNDLYNKIKKMLGSRIIGGIQRESTINKISRYMLYRK